MPQSHQKFFCEDKTTVSLASLMRWSAYAAQLSKAQRARILNPQAGQRVSSRFGQGMDFSGLRSYAPGDDTRHIDWRVTARTGKTYTKLFHEDRARPIVVVCELEASMYFGSRTRFKSVQAAQIAALLGWIAHYSGDAFGLFLSHGAEQQSMVPSHTQQSFLHGLSTLAQISQQVPASVLLNTQDTVPFQLKGTGATIYWLSDFTQIENSIARGLLRLSRNNSLLAICIRDQLEKAMPVQNKRYAVRSSESTEALHFVNHKAFSQRYAQHCAEQAQALRVRLAQHRIEMLSVQADEAPLKALLKALMI